MPKKLAVGATAALGLKAELERAKAEARKSGESGSKPQQRKTNKESAIWSKKNKGVEEREARDKEAHASDEKSLKRSREMLERKASLYDKMTRDPEAYISVANEVSVDFQMKKWTRASDHTSSEGGSSDSEGESSDGEQWIEIVDEFGRNRVVRKRDAPSYTKQWDRPTDSIYNEDEGRGQPEMVSADMEREMRRQEWERRAAEASTSTITNQYQHYEQSTEIREKGVGFYQLSQDEVTRKRQLEELARLRQETERMRSQKKPITEKRRQLIERRWAKVNEEQPLSLESRAEATRFLSDLARDLARHA